MATANIQSARTGEAGHCGKEVRSDAHVAIEPRDSSGLELRLESRVKPYYGEHILRQAPLVEHILN